MASPYFFDVHNGDGEVIDGQGMLVSSPDELPREVGRIMADIAKDEMPYDDHRGIVTVKVRDEKGRAVSVGSLTFTYEAIGN